uniref:Putative alpha subunit of photoactivated adenylyl cyclase n=1 Tax=Euglena quartana TaxID=56462 RepID=Q6L884_9EUGL|nr:putative alpha subunit of photoactivated adenylyl cyclase [Euglena quartana]
MYILVWKDGQQVKNFQDLEECGAFQTAANIVDGQIFNVGVTSAMNKGGDTGEVQLRRLMYLSASTEPEECTTEYLAELARASSLRNKEIGVSGFLLYSAPFFFQVIEGTDEDLDFLFAKISSDPRHEKCIVLANGPCTGRLYGEWHMKDSHIDNITKHPAIKTILFQIAKSFSSMWSYLSKNTANMLLLGKQPNKQAPEPMSVVISFIYLVEFSSILAHPGLTEQCADVLAAFVDVCVRNIEGTGGHVAKFITGICMAYWPSNRAEDALVGLQQLSDDLAELRSQQPPGSALSLVYSRCGVHYGRALLCNAGIKKADFTLLGDCINTASRITSLAGKLKVPLLLSFEVRCLLGAEMREELESAGMHKVKGREQPVQVFYFNAAEVDSTAVRAKIEQFNPGRYRALCPVKPYDSLHPSQKPPIFDDTPRDSMPRSGHLQRQDSLVDRLSMIAKLAFPPSMAAGGESQLIGLTYISQASHAMSRLDLSDIQRVAHRRNEQVNISACLLYINGLFVQTLEGPKSAVVSLYLKIRQDPRHKDVVVVHMAPLEERMYRGPLDTTCATDEMLATFPPLQDVLSQLAKSFISLETYVPSTIVRYLTSGNNPRNLQPVSLEVVMLATDICSFTPLSEHCSLTEIWTICNTFIDACTSAICSQGGEVIKLIGDCVTAYFPPTSADNAVYACQDIVAFCANLREAFRDVLDCRSVVACGVGLDFGQVIMAQCGSSGLTEFAVAGEVSARVMEVEALTREAGRAIVLTEPVADHLSPKLRDNGLVPCQEGVDGVPCYGILGAEWELDVVTIKRNIQNFHAARAVAAVQKVDDGMNAPGRALPVASMPAISSPSPKVRTAGRAASVASYAPDLNDLLDPRMAEVVFQELCQQRGEIPNNAVLLRLRQAAHEERADLGRSLQGPHELPPLTQALKQLTNVRALNMSDNFVDDTSIGDLIESCLAMRSLQMLDLSNNPGLTKVIALKRLIKHNPQLREIHLNGTRIAPTEQRKLQSSLNVNRLCASAESKLGSHKYEGAAH